MKPRQVMHAVDEPWGPTTFVFWAMVNQNIHAESSLLFLNLKGIETLTISTKIWRLSAFISTTEIETIWDGMGCGMDRKNMCSHNLCK